MQLWGNYCVIYGRCVSTIGMLRSIVIICNYIIGNYYLCCKSRLVLTMLLCMRALCKGPPYAEGKKQRALLPHFYHTSYCKPIVLLTMQASCAALRPKLSCLCSPPLEFHPGRAVAARKLHPANACRSISSAITYNARQ